MTPVRLKPAALRSRVKHSTTEALHSQKCPHVSELSLLGAQYSVKGTENIWLTRTADNLNLVAHMFKSTFFLHTAWIINVLQCTVIYT